MKIKLIELFKNIRKNIINFISIVVFIFLGVTLFQGLDYSGSAIKYSVNETFKQSNAYDVQVKLNTLVDSEFLDGLKSIEDVDDVQGFFYVNDDFVYNNKTYSASITSITDMISKCLVVEGHLPANDNEIAIFRGCSNEIGIGVGDTITFERHNTLSLLRRTFKDPTDFDPNNVNDLNFKNETFTVSAIVIHPEYLNHDVSSHSLDIEKGINTNATFFVNATAFNPSIKGDFYNAVYLKSNFLKDAKYFDDKYVEKTEGLKESISKYIEDNSSALKINYDLEDNQPLLNKAKEYLHDNGYLTDDIYLDDDAIKDYIDLIASDLNTLETAFSTKIMSEHVGVLMSDILYHILANERFAIGGVFFVIAFLICYSVINRLVNNEVKLIGTKKALGFSKKRIIITYLGFTLIAVFIGLIIGNLSSLLVEKLVVPIVLKSSFSLIVYTRYFNLVSSLCICAISFVATALITVISCQNVIKKKAITLLQGDMKVMGKKETLFERSKFFNKISLFYKTIFRNFKYEYKRIIATIIGISSCVALLMSAFSLKFTINESFEKEFNEYNIYDTIVYANTQVDDGVGKLETFFSENSYDYSPIYRDAVTFSIDDQPLLTGYIYIYFDNSSFNNLVNLDESDNNSKFENRGFWFPESYQKEYKCSNNSSVLISDFAGNSFTCTSEGYYKHYSYKGAIYVDYDSYKEVSGRELSPNSFLVNRHHENLDSFEDKMTDVEGYLYSYDSYGRLKADMSVFDLVSTVLFSLYGLATLLLAIFVILNLFMANIKEKKKELLTLIVNGYSRKKSSKYIYLDNILLTIISVIIGFGFGVGLSYFSLVSIESVYLYFIHSINVPSTLISIFGTLIIIFVMTLISLREVRKFKLTEINQN
ncbi:MAG: ABC transporter permease [Bacilli bacterium]|nr:ABC transporter permease [Bacilli bacterium]